MSFIDTEYYQDKFLKAVAENEVIQSRKFEECEFTGCSFIDCKFEKCTFVDCKFNDCVLSAIVPIDCRFLEVKFDRCKVIGVDWTKTKKIEELQFRECQINYSNFKFLKIPGIKIINSQSKDVDFTEADLSHGEFNNSDLENSRFFKTDLSYANLKGAKNYSIDVTNNVLKKTHFSLPEVLALLSSLDIIID